MIEPDKRLDFISFFSSVRKREKTDFKPFSFKQADKTTKVQNEHIGKRLPYTSERCVTHKLEFEGRI